MTYNIICAWCCTIDSFGTWTSEKILHIGWIDTWNVITWVHKEHKQWYESQSWIHRQKRWVKVFITGANNKNSQVYVTLQEVHHSSFFLFRNNYSLLFSKYILDHKNYQVHMCDFLSENIRTVTHTYQVFLIFLTKKGTELISASKNDCSKQHFQIS